MLNEQNPNMYEQGNQNQISAIRDILFGQNMKVYEDEFTQVRALIAQNKSEAESNLRMTNEQLSQLVMDTERRLLDQMQKNHEALLAAIAKLTDEKLDRRLLGKLLGDIGSHIAM
ncbi:MAG TPA: hypothetical protein PK239_06675 [Chitinophagales bacterium]|nr:hypothetical protein [Chitinophagales bacterium]HRK26961.1 hypothetical protein [Chitinophagales bacterium]